MTHSDLRARVSATFIRRLSLRNPIPGLCELRSAELWVGARTHEIITRSASLHNMWFVFLFLAIESFGTKRLRILHNMLHMRNLCSNRHPNRCQPWCYNTYISVEAVRAEDSTAVVCGSILSAP